MTCLSTSLSFKPKMLLLLLLYILCSYSALRIHGIIDVQLNFYLLKIKDKTALSHNDVSYFFIRPTFNLTTNKVVFTYHSLIRMFTVQLS